MNNEVLSIAIVVAFILVVLGVRWLVSFALHKGVDMASDAMERRSKTGVSGQVSLAQRYGQARRQPPMRYVRNAEVLLRLGRPYALSAMQRREPSNTEQLCT